jgi:hypothetical protein
MGNSCTQLDASTHTHTHAHSLTHTHTYIQLDYNADRHTDTYTHTHTHTHARTYTCIVRSLVPRSTSPEVSATGTHPVATLSRLRAASLLPASQPNPPDSRPPALDAPFACGDDVAIGLEAVKKVVNGRGEPLTGEEQRCHSSVSLESVSPQAMGSGVASRIMMEPGVSAPAVGEGDLDSAGGVGRDGMR